MPKANGAGDSGAPFQLPADLPGLTADQLGELLVSANAEMDALLAERNPEKLPRLGELSEARKTIVARQGEVKAEQEAIDAQFQAFADELTPVAEEGDGEGDSGSGEVVDGEIVEAPADATPSAPQLVTASGNRPAGGARAVSRDLGGTSGPQHRLNPSLSGARSFAPAAEPAAAQLAITASVGLPGQFEPGAKIDGLRQLGDLAERRARGMANAGGRYSARHPGDPYGGVQIASVRNDWGADVFSDSTPLDTMQAYMERVQGNRLASKMETLVAAGGWCAPLMPRYDFFNIACEDGMIDLPTFGVERGGVSFPDSPSLADTFSPALPWYTAFSSSTVPWLWTNTDDILAVTGSPTKPCIRVPCSSMVDVVLECYGICLTAGNLADNAWPESTRNFLRLLMAAHFHAANARYIARIATLATQITGCSVAGTGATAPILHTAELSSWDYRAKFGMCDSDVIEWVLPTWAKGLIRADLAKRTGVDPRAGFNITDADIASWFDVRNIRVQFVQDYQVRASGQPGALTPITNYPTTIKGLMYAAGTVARGNGMTLDLGVVRDSTLNETNDFTAAWMEECHLIAQFGHEIREYTMAVCPDGTTGAADLTSCC
jgi:hypothetical protein